MQANYKIQNYYNYKSILKIEIISDSKGDFSQCKEELKGEIDGFNWSRYRYDFMNFAKYLKKE